MRHDHKKQHPRRERMRHQASKVANNKNSRQSDTIRKGESHNGKREDDIKGMDIDLMNYTDI